MKKIVFIVVMSVFALACKPKQTVTNTKLDNKSERFLKGDWIVSSVNYVGSDVFKVTSFNIADAKCFEGSLWTFVSNNNTGEMVLNKTNCAAFGSQITWFINKDGKFVMKFLSEGVKAKHTVGGYVLKIANQTETSFQLIDRASVGSNSAEVVYQFDKI
ncbi:lipocalin family protein [Flavobacterium terrigena]|uniref:Lipocalin-like domain-containing protein n=1 Tax=Flavobacterium terrigena TaxID=402734 RepID=A0A1H6S701_9FLAO|nr:lipocalin family protein [Flavobacterium terrigena]SEI59192.1 Lipocalin-like domain-containing protein [Flavobacterium terrigena]